MFRTLIVEDNALFCQALHQVLTRSFPEMQITEAASGEDAVRQATAIPPDFVFMDISLPGKNGLETTRALKSVAASTTVCIMTSYDVEEYRDAARLCGADHFLVKGDATEAQINSVVSACVTSVEAQYQPEYSLETRPRSMA